MHTTPNKPVASAETEPTVSRGEFIRNLGMSSAALMAFYCMGTLSSCKGSSSDPTVTPVTPTTGNGITGTTTGNSISFTVDLTNSANSSLKTSGNSLKVGDVFIANAKSGYIAVQRLCTHQLNDALKYNLSADTTYNAPADTIVCTAHSSVFKTDGSVSRGPAGTALKKYTATLSADGNTLTVKS